MSEFDKLKDDAEQEVKDHPQQVHEAEQDAEHAVETKFGEQGQGNQQGQDDQDQRDDSGQNTDQGNQGQ
jgi:hypothetical protein